MAKSPGDRDPEATREAILSAALELFATVGYQGTSIKSIAKKAAVSEGLIYHHFENKYDLLVRIVSNFTEKSLFFKVKELALRIKRDSVQAKSGSSDVEEFLRGIFNIMIEQFERPPFRHLISTLLSSMNSLTPTEKATLVQDLHEKVWCPIAEVIDHILPDGAKTRYNPYILFRIIQGTLISYYLFQEHLGWKEIVPLDPREYGETFIHIFSKGLGGEARHLEESHEK